MSPSDREWLDLADPALLGAPHPPPPCADLPGGDVGTEQARAELEARRPHLVSVAEWLDRLFKPGQREDPRYHQYAVYAHRPATGSPGWRPSYQRYCTSALVAMLTGEPTGRDSHGVGAYYLGCDDHDDKLSFDVDAHRPGEAAETPFYHLRRLLSQLGVRAVYARSRGGRGYHAHVFLAQRLPGRVLRAFGAAVIKAAGLDPKTEVFPKGDELGEPGPGPSKVAGAQIALPGCLNFKLARGGSVLLDGATAGEIPFERWAAELESADAHRVTVEHLRAVGRHLGTDFFAEAPRRADPLGEAPVVMPRGVPRFARVGDVERFLASHGLDVARHGGWVRKSWTDRLVLRRCPNAARHGSAHEDGAAVLFDERSGRCGFKCHHNSCAELSWARVLRLLGCQVEVEGAPPARWRGGTILDSPPMPAAGEGPPAPAPAPPVIDEAAWADLPPAPGLEGDDEELEETVAGADPRHRAVDLGERGRERLARLAVDHFPPGSTERQRALRIAECGVSVLRKRCPDHGVVHEQVTTCGYVNACPWCATRRAMVHAAHAAEEWPDEVGALVFDAGEELADHDWRGALKLVERASRLMRKAARLTRAPARRWVLGARRFVFFFADPLWAGAVRGRLGDTVPGLEYRALSPLAAGELLREVIAEPALLLKRLLESAEGCADVADHPYLSDDVIKRTDCNRLGDKLPWYSEAEAQERARAEAAERDGADPDFDPCRCPRKVMGDDAALHPCGKPLRPESVLRGEVVAVGRPGGPGWAVERRAFAIMAADRVERRGVP